MKTFYSILLILSCFLLSSKTSAEDAASSAPTKKRKIAVQALPHEAFASLDGGGWQGVPHHFFALPGDHRVQVGAWGFGQAEVSLKVADRDLFVDVRLKRKRGYHAGLSLFSIGASLVMPGLVITILGATKQETSDDLIAVGAPVLGVGAALSLTGGLLLYFGGEKKPDIFVAPLLDLDEHNPRAR